MLHELPKGIQKVSREAKFNLTGLRTAAALGRGDKASHSLLIDILGKVLLQAARFLLSFIYSHISILGILECQH